MNALGHIWRVGWCFLILLQTAQPHFRNNYGFGNRYQGGFGNYGNGYNRDYGFGNRGSRNFGGAGHAHGSFGRGALSNSWDNYKFDSFGHGHGRYNRFGNGGYNRQANTGYNYNRYGGSNYGMGNYDSMFNSFDRYGKGFGNRGMYDGFGGFGKGFGNGMFDTGNKWSSGLGGLNDYSFMNGFGMNGGGFGGGHNKYGGGVNNNYGGLGGIGGFGGLDEIFGSLFSSPNNDFGYPSLNSPHHHHFHPPPQQPRYHGLPQYNMYPTYRQDFRYPVMMEHDNYLPNYQEKHTTNQYRNQYNYYIVNGKHADLGKIIPGEPPVWPPEGDGKQSEQTTEAPWERPEDRTGRPERPWDSTRDGGVVPPVTNQPPLNANPIDAITTEEPADPGQDLEADDEPGCAVYGTSDNFTECEVNRTRTGRLRPRPLKLTFEMSADPASVDREDLQCQLERALCETQREKFNGLSLSFTNPSQPQLDIILLMPITDTLDINSILAAVGSSDAYGQVPITNPKRDTNSGQQNRPSGGGAAAEPVEPAAVPKQEPVQADKSQSAKVKQPDSDTTYSNTLAIGVGVSAAALVLVSAAVIAVLASKLSKRKSASLLSSSSSSSRGSKTPSVMSFTSLDSDSSSSISSDGRTNIFPDKFRGGRMMWRDGDTMPDKSAIPAHIASTSQLHTVEEIHANVIGSV